MAGAAQADGDHRHDDDCRAWYAEWSRYDAVASDGSGRYPREIMLEAARERDKYEHQLTLRGCSVEAMRRATRAAESATHGTPLP